MAEEKKRPLTPFELTYTKQVYDYISSEMEKVNDPSQIEAGVAGIASGIIRIPAGIPQFAAEVIDLGLGTDLATDFEKIIDRIDPFDKVAEEKALGKITQTLTQLVGVGKIGSDVFSAIVDKAGKAIKAKRSGKYADLKNPNVRKAVEKADKLNKASKTKRFAVGLTGAAIGEAFVYDVEGIGTLGDVFEGGPTQLDRDERDDPSEDAARRLLNRLKFGFESLLITPFVYGGAKMVGALATRGKELAYSDSVLERFFDKVGSLVRARGAKPQEIFEGKRTEIGRGMADTNKAMELVKEIDKSVSKIFPTIRTTFNKSLKKERKEFVEELNDLMFSGKLDEPLSANLADKIYKTVREKNLNQDDAKTLLNTIEEARKKFSGLINLSSNAPKDIATLRGLMGDRVDSYLGNTYKIFEDKPILPFQVYKPTEEAIEKAKNLFKRYAQKNNQVLTDLDAEQMVSNLLKTVPKNITPGELPFFKYINLTAAAEKPYVKKAFQRTVEKKHCWRICKRSYWTRK